jgi:hypothetical protein
MLPPVCYLQNCQLSGAEWPSRSIELDTFDANVRRLEAIAAGVFATISSILRGSRNASGQGRDVTFLCRSGVGDWFCAQPNLSKRWWRVE